jgi:LysR family glycine cleavage system transcriptional activator
VQAALEGLGAVIVSPMLVVEDVRRRRMRRIAAEVVDTVDSYWLVMPPGRPTPALQAFRAWLLEEIETEAAAAGHAAS